MPGAGGAVAAQTSASYLGGLTGRLTGSDGVVKGGTAVGNVLPIETDVAAGAALERAYEWMVEERCTLLATALGVADITAACTPNLGGDAAVTAASISNVSAAAPTDDASAANSQWAEASTDYTAFIASTASTAPITSTAASNATAAAASTAASATASTDIGGSALASPHFSSLWLWGWLLKQSSLSLRSRDDSVPLGEVLLALEAAWMQASVVTQAGGQGTKGGMEAGSSDGGGRGSGSREERDRTEGASGSSDDGFEEAVKAAGGLIDLGCAMLSCACPRDLPWLGLA